MNKIRKWLIKALGGYTDQVYFPQTKKIICNYTPITLKARYALDCNCMDNYNEDMKELLKNKLAMDLSKEAIKSNLIEFYTDDCSIYAKITIIPSNNF